jgi:COP9 signalosome complex subunit 7
MAAQVKTGGKEKEKEKEVDLKDTKVDPLENLRALADTTKGDGLTFVINSAIKHPQIFVFGEILNCQSVKDLANNPNLKSYLDLLKIFAYGTYPDFKARERDLKLKEIHPKAITKLKMLSIVEYASKNKFLSYEKLQKELDVQTLRDLEDLIIDCVYNGLIQGKLDQRKKAFEVQWVMGRDLGPTEVEDMIKTVEVWLKQSESLLTSLTDRMKVADTVHEKKKNEAAAISKEKHDTVEHIKQILQSNDQEAIAAIMGMPSSGAKGGDPKGKRKGGGAAGGPGGLLGMGQDLLRKIGGGGRR